MLDNLKYTFSSTLQFAHQWRRFLGVSLVFVCGMMLVGYVFLLVLASFSEDMGRGDLSALLQLRFIPWDAFWNGIWKCLLSARVHNYFEFILCQGLAVYALYLKKLENQGFAEQPSMTSLLRAIWTPTLALFAVFIWLYMIPDLVLNEILSPTPTNISSSRITDLLLSIFQSYPRFAHWLDSTLYTLRNVAVYLSPFLLLILSDRSSGMNVPVSGYKKGFGAFMFIALFMMSVNNLIQYILKEHVAGGISLVLPSSELAAGIILFVLSPIAYVFQASIYAAMIFYSYKFERDRHFVRVQQIGTTANE